MKKQGMEFVPPCFPVVRDISEIKFVTSFLTSKTATGGS